MYSNFKKLIFKFDPETAHDLAIKALKTNLFPKINLDDDEMFKTSLFGKDIKNPIGIAAGFDKDAEVYNQLSKLGFGFVEVGTVTPKKQLGNQKPRVFRLEDDEALINRLGFNNSGSDKIRKRIIENAPSCLLGINIGPNKDTKNRIDDYLFCLNKFYDIADYITVNISSPNTDNLRNFHNVEELDSLLKVLSKEKKKLKCNIPLVVKISPDISTDSVKEISCSLLGHNIQAIIVSNTTDSNRDLLKSHERFQKGGLSGKPLNDISNSLIKKFHKNLEGKIDIIGVGGINSGQAAFEKFSSGAKYLQLYTGMVFEGPYIIKKILNELKEILIGKKIKNLGEITNKY